MEEGIWTPKNFGVAPLCQTPSWCYGGREEGRGTEKEKKGRKDENGRGGKLEQADPVWTQQTRREYPRGKSRVWGGDRIFWDCVKYCLPS